MTSHAEATAIHALPAIRGEQGFRLLVMRELREDGMPPAFALIAQGILREPQRRNRHGVSFAATFRPEIMDWLSTQLGRPSQRDAEGTAWRNPRWPTITWHSEERTWPDGIKTVEWSVDVTFADASAWTAFAACWQDRLDAQTAELHPEAH